jgi:DNA polymerase-1
MLALIDLDILPYSYGGMSFEDGSLMPEYMVKVKVDEKIQRIMENSGSNDWVGYLTHSASNFRLDVGTILPYKGNRSGSTKPPHYQMLRDHILATYPDKVTLVRNYEADDQLAIDQYEDAKWSAEDFQTGNYLCNTIICTIDKDLKMVPGWHYNWNNDELVFVTEVEGLRWFYKQCLTGDMTDNIKGLHGVGAKSTLLSKLDAMDTEQQMFEHVHAEYEKRFGSYADMFLIENGTLLWMMKDKEDRWVNTFNLLKTIMITNKENENNDSNPF